MRIIFQILIILLICKSAICQTDNSNQESKDFDITTDYWIKAIQFNENSATDYDKELVNILATKLLDYSVNVEIVSHCTKKELKVNPKISKERAIQVKKHLIGMGISENRIFISDQKAEQPINPNENEENSRVQIYILE